MKNKINFNLYLMGFIALFLVIGLFSAFKGEGSGSTGQYYRPTIAVDTLTNAETITVSIPQNLLSEYTYCYQLVRTNISGTTNILAVIDESSNTSGSADWKAIDTISGTSGIGRATGDEVYGVRHRVRLVGTGTQSTQFTLVPTFKRKN